MGLTVLEEQQYKKANITTFLGGARKAGLDHWAAAAPL